MATQYQTMFEAPSSNEATYYSNPYSNPEFEDEWEDTHESYYSNPYSNSEFEDEWEMEGLSAYGNPEFEDEWEMDGEGNYGNSEFEDEWEMDGEGNYGNPEFEDAAEYEAKKKRGRFLSWLKKAWSKVRNVARKVVKKVLPMAATVAGSAFGGPIGGAVGKAVGGAVSGAMEDAIGTSGGGIAKALEEAEMEVTQMESEFFGMGESDAEVAPTAAARDAALAEYLAAQAAEAGNDSEAEAYAAAALPATIASMNAQQQLRPYIPMLVHFYALLTRMLLQEGLVGKQVMRGLPYQHRRMVSALRTAARRGERLSGPKAVMTAAAVAQKVMGSGSATKRAMMKNVAIQSRTARPAVSPSKLRQKGNRESASYCPTCGHR